MTSRPTFSVELFPPKDEAGEERLWTTLEKLMPLKPDYVAVTYGAGGSTRDRTIRITSQITERSSIPTIAHLTCVGSTEKQLTEILNQYKSAGINSILALRGDPSGGPQSEWVSTPGGFDHADQLVELAISLGFEVAVAAFPDGHPASAGDFERDLKVLIRKEELGATSATTQFFFDPQRYFALVNGLKERGSKLMVYPGVLPITNVKQVKRMAELGGTPIPSWILQKLSEAGEDAAKVREIGIEIAIELASALLAGGVPGIHFYTMNSASPTDEIVKRIGLR